jgi:hypothetical protein
MDAASSSCPPNVQRRDHAALWAKRNSDGLEIRLQGLRCAEKPTVVADSQILFFVLIDKEVIGVVLSLVILLSFCWFAWKGSQALV